MTEAVPPGDDRLREEIEFVRAQLDRGQSDLLRRLFEYLVESLRFAQAPKEIEIAHELFGAKALGGSSEGPSVRVHVHRLRKRLDAIYSERPGPRLQIPLGNYRIILVDGPPASVEDDVSDVRSDHPGEPAARPFDTEEPPPLRTWLPRRRQSRLLVLCATLLALVVGATAWFLLVSPNEPDSRTSLWAGVGANGRPTLIVTGDYYMFAQLEPSTDVSRLIRDFSINSSKDLDHYLMTHPEEQGRFGDVDLHYVPTSVANALGSLVPSLARAVPLKQVPPRVVSMSSVTPDLLKENNIVYVGLLSGLGLLQDPVLSASDFRIGSSFDELVDAATGRKYASDWSNILIDQTPRHDYSYIASVPSPEGNRTIVIAGTRDAALRQAGEIAADPSQMSVLLRRVGGASAFEALYETRALGNTNLGSRLVLARALNLKPAKAVYK